MLLAGDRLQAVAHAHCSSVITVPVDLLLPTHAPLRRRTPTGRRSCPRAVPCGEVAALDDVVGGAVCGGRPGVDGERRDEGRTHGAVADLVGAQGWLGDLPVGVGPDADGA